MTWGLSILKITPMGCTDSRSELSDVEYTLTTTERCLTFHISKAWQSDFVIRKFSSQGKINASQLAEALIYLNFRGRNDPQVKAFYDSISGANGIVSMKQLLIATILLGKGTDLEKADLLFEVYDDEDSRVLREIAVKNFVSDLYEVVVVHLPTLITTQPPSEDNVKVTNYIEQIKFRGDRGKEKLAAKLLDNKPSITSGDFKGSLTSPDNRTLLKTWGLRDFFFKTYKVIPAAYNIEKHSIETRK
mmetsp:Transcript_25770/g.45383  ORF Transcript_25770/g.45383 Transcript_25770/m.45383 type:complete len:246 (+) Transcript_25770:6247-6984(+)